MARIFKEPASIDSSKSLSKTPGKIDEGFKPVGFTCRKCKALFTSTVRFAKDCPNCRPKK